jgi:hypothetical protein
MEKKKLPFFARFLEAQETEEARSELLKVRTDLKAGKPPGWGGGGPPLVTMKYPSDDDEGGVNI